MAAVAFDSLEYARQLQAAGMPRQQAEVIAKGMTAMFIHNFDALVTKDYLDTRFSEFGTRMDLRFVESEARVDARFADFEARMDARFAESEARVDLCFAESEARVDSRFAEFEARINSRFAELKASMDLRFERIESKFSRIYLMFGLTMVTATIPILQNIFMQAS